MQHTKRLVEKLLTELGLTDFTVQVSKQKNSPDIVRITHEGRVMLAVNTSDGYQDAITKQVTRYLKRDRNNPDGDMAAGAKRA